MKIGESGKMQSKPIRPPIEARVQRPQSLIRDDADAQNMHGKRDLARDLGVEQSVTELLIIGSMATPFFMRVLLTVKGRGEEEGNLQPNGHVWFKLTPPAQPGREVIGSALPLFQVNERFCRRWANM
ncbi:MAG: hypothetical protein LUP94_02345 [Candidatus Methanomethylicus sp.]|nr:hypothetical protein [Candidatus Methanomethylicus sp.]